MSAKGSPSLFSRPRLQGAVLLGALWSCCSAAPAKGLPPPEEIPEEILRTEIIREARSPLTGEPLTTAEYAALQAELADKNDAGTITSDVRQLIFLLQLRRGVRPLVPFIP